jgi:environmental stress-induced protein Ves
MTLPSPQALADLRQEAWANGNGTTTTILAGPDPQAWLWRLSIARIERDGSFSANPSTRRLLAPLDAAIRVTEGDGRQRDVLRHQTLAFAGAPPLDCHLPDGPTRAFNLMLREGFEGELLARPIVGSMMLPAYGGATWFVLAVTGRMRVTRADEARQLDAGDYLGLPPAKDGERTLLEGHGEVVLVRLSSTPSMPL